MFFQVTRLDSCSFCQGGTHSSRSPSVKTDVTFVGGCDICGNLPLLSLARFLFRCRSCWRSLNSFRGPHAQDARKEDVPRGLEFSICPRSSCRPRRRLSAARAVSRPPPPLTPSWCLISRTFHVDVGRPSYPEYPPRVILEASMTLSGFSPARGRGRRLSRRDRSRTPRSAVRMSVFPGQRSNVNFPKMRGIALQSRFVRHRTCVRAHDFVVEGFGARRGAPAWADAHPQRAIFD